MMGACCPADFWISIRVSAQRPRDHTDSVWRMGWFSDYTVAGVMAGLGLIPVMNTFFCLGTGS